MSKYWHQYYCCASEPKK